MNRIKDRSTSRSVLTLSFCFSVSRLLSSSRSYSVTRTFFSQSLIRSGNSVSSLSRQGSMTARQKHHQTQTHTDCWALHLHKRLWCWKSKHECFKQRCCRVRSDGYTQVYPGVQVHSSTGVLWCTEQCRDLHLNPGAQTLLLALSLCIVFYSSRVGTRLNAAEPQPQSDPPINH